MLVVTYISLPALCGYRFACLTMPAGATSVHWYLEVFTLPHIVWLDSAGLSPDFGLENLVKMGENRCNFLVTVQWTVWSDKESIGQYQWTFQWTVIRLSSDKYQKTPKKVTGINSLQIMLYIILIRFLSWIQIYWLLSHPMMWHIAFLVKYSVIYDLNWIFELNSNILVLSHPMMWHIAFLVKYNVIDDLNCIFELNSNMLGA